MNIGFDLDKVFINYPPFIPDYVIDKFYKKKANGTLLYRMPSKPEQIIRKLSHHPILRAPIAQNINLISSRFGFLEVETVQLMKRHGFDKIFDGLYFNFSNKQPHIFKNEIINKLNLDIYVDDDFHLLKYVAKFNKKTKFYWLNRKRENSLLTRNIIAIKKLPDILKSSYAVA